MPGLFKTLPYLCMLNLVAWVCNQDTLPSFFCPLPLRLNVGLETPRQVFYSPEAAEAATVLRGLPPATFIMSPQDLIVARVRDIDDKVKKKTDEQPKRARDTRVPGDSLFPEALSPDAKKLFAS